MGRQKNCKNIFLTKKNENKKESGGYCQKPPNLQKSVNLWRSGMSGISYKNDIDELKCLFLFNGEKHSLFCSQH